MDRRACQPQPQRLPADAGHHLGRHQRVAPQQPRQGGAIQGSAQQGERGVESALTLAVHLHVHAQGVVRQGEAPAVVARHRQERRNMEGLVEPPFPSVAIGRTVAHRQHVAVPLAPRRVGDLREHGFQRGAIGLEAVVEAHRVEDVARVAQVGEQADRSLRAVSQLPLHAVTHRLGQRLVVRRQVVAAMECGQIAVFHRPQRAPIEHAVEFVQVQVELRHAVAERVRSGRVTAVPNPAFVNGAGERCGHTGITSAPRTRCTSCVCASNASTSARALRIPSSWKPHPQYAPANQARRAPWISLLRDCATTIAWS